MSRTWTPQPAITGIVAPILITPAYVGQIYINTNANTVYVAKWTADSNDWIELS